MSAIDLVKQVRNIFSLPEIVIKINEELNKPEPDFSKLEKLILLDPALTAKILRFVNSSYFGFKNSIDNVSHAAAILGLLELKHLIMGVSVTSQFKNIPKHLLDVNAFWYQSIFKGVLAKTLAKRLDKKDFERFYITGLLSSIGKLIFLSQYPDKSETIFNLDDQSDLSILNAEKELFGCNYIELSTELLKEWKLPDEICEMVCYQLNPLNEESQNTNACILHVAVKVSNTMQPFCNENYDINVKSPDFNPDVLEHLQLTTEQIQLAVNDALQYPSEILKIINPSA